GDPVLRTKTRAIQSIGEAPRALSELTKGYALIRENDGKLVGEVCLVPLDAISEGLQNRHVRSARFHLKPALYARRNRQASGFVSGVVSAGELMEQSAKLSGLEQALDDIMVLDAGNRLQGYR